MEALKDVHTEHCCIMHGCKYCDPDCTVVTGQAQQSFRCESCHDQGIESVEEAQLFATAGQNAVVYHLIKAHKGISSLRMGGQLIEAHEASKLRSDLESLVQRCMEFQNDGDDLDDY